MTKACPECGLDFRPRTNAMTCSKECARKRRTRGSVQRCRERYATDPEYREQVCAASAKYRQNKTETDADYREKERARSAHKQREKRRDPIIRVRDIQRASEYLREKRATDSGFRDRDNARRTAAYRNSRDESAAKLLQMLFRGELAEMGDPCFVYMFRDGAGALLYVGIAIDPKRRLYQHARDKDWFDRIASVEMAPFQSGTEAMAAEAFLIKALRPRFNIQHNGRHFQSVQFIALATLISKFASVEIAAFNEQAA